MTMFNVFRGKTKRNEVDERKQVKRRSNKERKKEERRQWSLDDFRDDYEEHELELSNLDAHSCGKCGSHMAMLFSIEGLGTLLFCEDCQLKKFFKDTEEY